ncbi:MAG TPA: NAD-dependent epimerase/dehydratase family protein [Acidimicrobiia bacterium]|nr:NAD-dependent epimerase/dehydratase family protein [Acidimicrobiia bacterium]
MTRDVAVTGGSGLVGGHLVSRLVAEGRSVRALVRSESSASVVSALGADPYPVDLFDDSGLRRALWGVPLLFHVAGVNDPCPRDVAAMDHVNIEGTRSVVRAAAEAGVRRIVYTSSAVAIGEREGIVGTESIVHSGEYHSPYARSKHLAELVAFETAADLGIDLVGVNPSSVQGPGRSGGSARILLYALRSRRPWVMDTHVSIVDIEDCTDGHLAAVELGRPLERYLLSGATVSVREALELAQAVANVELRPRWLSAGLVRALGRPASRIIGAIRPGSGVCPALIDTLLHGHRFDASRSRRELGIEYTPLAETFARTIEWFRAEGLIESP